MCVIIPHFIHSSFTDATIGFLNTAYSVNENDGVVALEVGVLDGFLEREVVVLFSTSDNNAAGIYT